MSGCYPLVLGSNPGVPAFYERFAVAKIYGVPRPQPVWGVQWTGDNIQEIKDAFVGWPGSMFFVNEENGNLCFGETVEDANQYALGSIMVLMGGVGGMSVSEWEAAYSTVDTNDRIKYSVVQDEES